MMDEQWQPGWKVVAFRRAGYASWIDSNCAVAYRAGVVTRPRPGTGPLAVFCSRGGAAAQYAVRHGEAEARGGIVPCAYLPSTETEIWTDARRTPIEHLARGTRLATAVVLWPAE